MGKAAVPALKEQNLVVKIEMDTYTAVPRFRTSLLMNILVYERPKPEVNASVFQQASEIEHAMRLRLSARS